MLAVNSSGSAQEAVVTLSNREHAPEHEKQSHTEIARRVAILRHSVFEGEYAPQLAADRPLYYVPSQTIVGVEAADALSIKTERDLLGGVVPEAFMGTKAITHPLVSPGAYAPKGWSYDLCNHLEGVCLNGFSVFSQEDARKAARRLLEKGPFRIKPVRATAGRGQIVVSTRAQAESALAEQDNDELSHFGLVLEEALEDVTTLSVGQIKIGDHLASYYGTQRLVQDHNGCWVYGGSELIVVRGGFDELCVHSPDASIKLAIEQARRYDAAAAMCYPGFFSSRRNYDVVQGHNISNQWVSGVLEQSWRMGGATSAEILALEAFAADDSLHILKATSRESYDYHEKPFAQAVVFYQGHDPEIGFITKSARLEPYGNP